MLKWSRGFSFALRKAIGIEEASFVQESPSSVPGHWVCWLLCLGDGGKRGRGRFSHVLMKCSLGSLVTNVKVIGEPREGEVISWWVGNVPSVAAPGHHCRELSAV